MRFLLFSKRKIDVLLSKLVFVGNTNEYVSHTSYVIVVYTVYGQILRGGETILGGEISNALKSWKVGRGQKKVENPCSISMTDLLPYMTALFPFDNDMKLYNTTLSFY